MNPEKFEIDTFSSDPVMVKGGAHITHVLGCVRYSFGDYGIYPIEIEVDTDITPDVASDQPENQYSIGTLNCHVFIDDDNTVLQTRAAKFSKYIREVMKSPDIVALQEVENMNVAQTLANKIHSDDASLTYTPYIVEYDDFSGLNTAYLVKNTVTVTQVDLVGETATFSMGGYTYDTFDRPPYLLYAQIGNFAFRVLNVHLRSRNSIDDPQDGEFVRTKRHEQSLWIANYIQNIQNNNPAANVAIVGDYNAFEFTDGYVDVLGQITGDPDPLGAMFEVENIVNPPLVNLTKSDEQNNRYSYVYNGDAQALDHIVLTSSFNNYARYFKFVHANSDYPEYFENDASTPIGCSDHDGAVFRFTTYPNDVAEEGVIPEKFELKQNYPNPFNPTTEISYSIPEATQVSLSVFNELGQKVATLAQGYKNAGNYKVQFDAKDFSSGIYFYRLSAGSFTATKKMLLLK
jgi:endonuclease/exonuclease/phosphatase family metal-dependent hydrolase